MHKMGVPNKLFLLTQLVIIVVSGSLLAGSFISLYTTIGVFTSYVPIELVQATGIVSGAVFVVSIIGMVSSLSEISLLFNAFFILSGLQIIFNLCFLVFFLLFTNGVKTIPALDNLVNDTFTNFENEIATIALKDNDYAKVQNALDCCGVDFEACYPVENQEKLLTGKKCSKNSALEIIANLTIDFPEFNDDGQAAADANNIIGSDDFFCGPVISALNERLFSILGAVLGVIIVLELLSFVFTLFMLKTYKDEHEESDQEVVEMNPEDVTIKIRINPRPKMAQALQPLGAGADEDENGPDGRELFAPRALSFNNVSSRFRAKLGTLASSFNSKLSGTSGHAIFKSARKTKPRQPQVPVDLKDMTSQQRIEAERKVRESNLSEFGAPPPPGAFTQDTLNRVPKPITDTSDNPVILPRKPTETSINF